MQNLIIRPLWYAAKKYRVSLSRQLRNSLEDEGRWVTDIKKGEVILKSKDKRNLNWKQKNSITRHNKWELNKRIC